ncbi:ADP-ribosylglycohydrolase domain-containing protein [Sarocladium implicatum]|jgi:ADP-ribosylglycohydrolase|nr:ADP-ribosylglycohydrolase domain-containing protein [Sarocladium implicatum]
MSTLTPRQSRVVGALLGVHAGDSLGATLEFRSHAWILKNHPNGLRDIIGGGSFNWKPGHATDDTDMTRAILLAYRDLHRRQQGTTPSQDENAAQEPDILTLAADYFLAWFTGNNWPDRKPGTQPLDIGGATSIGLVNYIRHRDPTTSGAGQGSAGNGSLMRCIPTALFEPDPEERQRDSMRLSAVTHNDVRCTVACAAYNAIAAELVAGKTPDEAVEAGELVASSIQASSADGKRLYEGASQVLASIHRGRTLSLSAAAASGPPVDLEGGCGGYVLETLTLAIAAVLDERTLEDVLVDVVRIGRDTDTNGAVAGGLLGARDGVEGIPQRWIDKLQFGDEFRLIALELTSA